MVGCKIVEKLFLAPDVVSIHLQAKQIAKVRKPGQFIILRINDGGERIPLTIADADSSAGTLRLIVQVVGKTTRQLASLEPGQTIQDVVGPLGKPTHLENFGHAVCVGGGVGTGSNGRPDDDSNEEREDRTENHETGHLVAIRPACASSTALATAAIGSSACSSMTVSGRLV